jgi:ribosomal protein S18 acetylase RimI-like enzyme
MVGGTGSGEFRIRRAVPADAPMLARLRYDFRQELDPVEEPEDLFLRRCTDWMSGRLQPGGTWRCFVAMHREHMVGTLWLQEIEKLPNPVGHPERHGYVSSVYVIPESRDLGIGSALLQACAADAGARGLDALFLWPSDRSRPLYHRHGFEAGDLLQRRL